MRPSRIKRRHPTFAGVHQRCAPTCPEPCDAHSWSWYAQTTLDGRRIQKTHGGYVTAEEAHTARQAVMAQRPHYLAGARGRRAPRPYHRPAPHPPTAPDEKYCPACRSIKPSAMFNKNARGFRGLADYCKNCHSDRRREYHQRIKRECLEMLGGACRCCGQTRLVFLQIDHINGDGAAHRRELTGGRNVATNRMYRWVLDNPDEARRRCQVLCANCNIAKELEEGHSCPRFGRTPEENHE